MFKYLAFLITFTISYSVLAGNDTDGSGIIDPTLIHKMTLTTIPGTDDGGNAIIAGGSGSGPGSLMLTDHGTLLMASLPEVSFSEEILSAKFVEETDGSIIFKVKSENEEVSLEGSEEVLINGAPEILDALEESSSSNSPDWVEI